MRSKGCETRVEIQDYTIYPNRIPPVAEGLLSVLKIRGGRNIVRLLKVFVATCVFVFGQDIAHACNFTLPLQSINLGQTVNAGTTINDSCFLFSGTAGQPVTITVSAFDAAFEPILVTVESFRQSPSYRIHPWTHPGTEPRKQPTSSRLHATRDRQQLCDWSLLRSIDWVYVFRYPQW